MDANNGMVVAKALSKKQQAIIGREFELLEIAKKVVEREGYAHLTMDKVAALGIMALEYQRVVF